MLLSSLIGSVLLGCLSLIQAQPALRRRDLDDIGVFNGHLVGLDDVNVPDYADLRGFLGINNYPAIRPVVGAVAPVAGTPILGPIKSMRQRRCQKNTCPRGNKIERNCRYTPILQDLNGQYCRGCDQNLCLDMALRGGNRGVNTLTGLPGTRAENKEERKRLRKMRRKVCRETNVCLGESRKEILEGQLRRSLSGRGRVGGARGIVGGQNPMGVLAGQGPLGVIAGQGPLGVGMVPRQPQVGIVPGPAPVGVFAAQPTLGLLGGQRPILGNVQRPIMGGGLLGNLFGNALGNAQMQLLTG